jgi:hypothetical protein
VTRFVAVAVAIVVVCGGCATAPGGSAPAVSPAAAPPLTTPRPTPAGRSYPWHTGIIATTFWVGEIFDPNAADGSQMQSTYNADWYSSYGGCDGKRAAGRCDTERRTAVNDYFPTAMKPQENPFYLDLPYDDVNDPVGFAKRGRVIPWASDAAYRSAVGDPSVSLLKNRWVRLRKGDRVCYGQIEDAGPGKYHDARYVFGADDVRPANRRYNGAGLDVSPALNGCLGFAALNGDGDRVDWQFVEASDVPDGPWRRLVTTTPLNN